METFSLSYMFRLDAASPGEALTIVKRISLDKESIDREVEYQSNPLVMGPGVGYWSVLSAGNPQLSSEGEPRNHFWVSTAYLITSQDRESAVATLSKYWGTPALANIATIEFDRIRQSPGFFFDYDKEAGVWRCRDEIVDL